MLGLCQALHELGSVREAEVSSTGTTFITNFSLVPETRTVFLVEKMFNALNRFISRLDSDSPAQNSNHGAFGFQVLQNKNLELGIEPWFDFIVGINGRMIVS